jgi:hypothetical protein
VPRGGWQKFFTANKLSGHDSARVLRQFQKDKAERKRIMKAEEAERKRLEVEENKVKMSQKSFFSHDQHAKHRKK